jgi:hypothetical protein
VGSVLYKQMAGHFEKQKHSLQWAFSLFKMPRTLFFLLPIIYMWYLSGITAKKKILIF